MADEQTRKSFDDAGNQSDQPFESQTDGPAGEQLSHHDAGHLDPQIPSNIVDDEAEELSGQPVEDRTPGHADPGDMVIDDERQLAEAEATAARARSSRPVRRKRTTAESAETTGAVDAPAAPADEQPPAQTSQTMPRPVRRPVKREKPAEAPSTEVAERRTKRSERAAKGAQVAHQRTTPAGFVGQSAAELRKVIWPTSSQLSQYFVVVLLFVLFIVAYVGLLDPAFGWVLLKFLGK